MNERDELLAEIDRLKDRLYRSDKLCDQLSKRNDELEKIIHGLEDQIRENLIKDSTDLHPE